MGKIKLLLVFAFSIVITSSSALAFSESIHKDITTRAAVAAGYRNVAFIDALIRGNVAADCNPYTDKSCPDGEWFVPEAHFDNEQFSKGSKRLTSLVLKSIEALKNNNHEMAGLYIGRGLHAVQDFFSHSNFVEKFKGTEQTIDLFNLRDPDANISCRIYTGPLTSGYYFYSSSDYSSGRARHMTMPSGKCTHDDLHKDGESREENKIAQLYAKVYSVWFLKVVEKTVQKVYLDETKDILYRLKYSFF